MSTIWRVFLPTPRGFRDPAAVLARVALLELDDAAAPLRTYMADLVARRNQRHPGTVVPSFDPAEGGTACRALLVHEAPGPMTLASGKRQGSGFISVDNDDPTAETVWNLRNEVGLHSRVLSWNIVPWYLGAASRKPTAAELREGAVELRHLIALLPDLQVLVAGGLHAQRGLALIEPLLPKQVTYIKTWHPGPQAMLQPGKRDELKRAYERTARAAF